MIVALDAMGGDFAPQAAIDGALLALSQQPGNVHVELVGDKAVIEAHLAGKDLSGRRLSIHHAPEVIEMGEHPTRALTQKPDSSIGIGFKLLAAGKIGAFCSAGNTGAMLVGAMFSVKTIPGILRPAIAGFVPKISGGYGVIIDAGANTECKAEILQQFAEMGSLYAKHVLHIQNPKVALLNVGEEEKKGTAVLQATYQLLKNDPKINFVGNIEGRDIFHDKADVVVTDGFTGNVVLKLSESVYEIMAATGIEPGPFFSRLNYETVGGSPIIGVNGNVIIGHGVSTPTAIAAMIDQAVKMIDSDINEKIKQGLGVTAAPDLN
ncbi:MAG: phosphate acyltransferase PlsX [Bacteroidota bacterium]